MQRVVSMAKTPVWSVLLLLSLCGSIANAQTPASATAKLVVSIESDSVKTESLHYFGTRYLNEQCKKPRKRSRLFRKKFADPKHEFPAFDVSSDEEFMFQIDYQEDRRDGDRACANLISFTPKAGSSYKAILSVTGQGSFCEVNVIDLADDKDIEIWQPELSCKRSNRQGLANGVVEFRSPRY